MQDPKDEERQRNQFLAQVVYPKVVDAMRPIARAHGYALAVHGSQIRDLDLIAVPWIPEAASPYVLIKALRDVIPSPYILNGFEKKPHGRIAWLIGFWCDDLFLTVDISITSLRLQG